MTGAERPRGGVPEVSRSGPPEGPVGPRWPGQQRGPASQQGEPRGRRGRAAVPAPKPAPLAVPVLDAHCHLDMVDPDNVLTLVDEAQRVGVQRLIATGVDVPTSRWCAETASAFDDVWAVVAVHPNDAGTADDEALREIERLAGLPDVRGVGETGLDFYRDTATREEQERSFRAHIAIAKRFGKPLVIHDRDAHDDVLRVLDEEGAPDCVVFHCFSGDAAFARRCVDAGYVLSFAGTVTFKNAEPLREAAQVCPVEQMLVETDAPFLTPHPYRGHPNAPAMVPLTVRCLAETTGRDLDELCAGIAATGERVFGPW